MLNTTDLLPIILMLIHITAIINILPLTYTRHLAIS